MDLTPHQAKIKLTHFGIGLRIRSFSASTSRLFFAGTFLLEGLCTPGKLLLRKAEL